jgi:beta-1,4-mannosyl-glycoprotein beta-1,4-N-acetylglucosaminyltransferase
MRVFDCFTFFNELELLEFRLKFLDPYVDFFVIAESNLTHAGQEKPYYFEAARERFKAWEQKIIYIPVAQSTSGLVFESQNQYNPASAAWKLENEQRNALLSAADQMQDDDLVIMGDLDEIPSPAAIQKAKSAGKPIAFSLLFHYYFLNCQNTGNSRWWKGCIAADAKQFRSITPQGLRDKRDEYPSISHAGWHFSFLGGVEKIKEKLQAFAHTEFSKAVYTNEDNIREALSKGEDILKRDGVRFQYLPLSYYPIALQQVMKAYPQLLHLPPANFFSNIFYTFRRISKAQY